jgi:hypothetical protein
MTYPAPTTVESEAARSTVEGYAATSAHQTRSHPEADGKVCSARRSRTEYNPGSSGAAAQS